MISNNNVLYRTNNKPIVWDMYFKNDGVKKPLVVFCHGYKGFKDWGCWNLVAEEFLKEHKFFVKFNFSHNGGTIENPIDFPDLKAFAENNYTKELDDLDSMLDHLLSPDFTYASELDRNTIVLIGHSRGGGIAAIKAAEDNNVSKLITWASVSDFGRRTATKGDLKQWEKDGVKYVLNGRTKQQMPHNYQFYEDFIANEGRLNIRQAVSALKCSHLIIHGSADSSIAFTEAEELHLWNPNSTLCAIENANHVFNSKHPWEAHKMPAELQQVVFESINFIN